MTDKMVIGVTLLILAALLVMVSTTVTQEPAALSDDDADGGSGWILLFAGMGAGTGFGALLLAIADSVRSTMLTCRRQRWWPRYQLGWRSTSVGFRQSSAASVAGVETALNL